MILAAGRGERLRPLTDSCPKPLLEVGGRSLIARHLDVLAAAGVREAVINTSWLGEQIAAALGGTWQGMALRYSPEPEGRLETGGGIFRALPLLGTDPFLLVNADVLCDASLAELAATRLAGADLCHLLMVANPPHNPAGDFALRDGRLSARGDGQRLTYSGLGLLRPELFAGCRPGRFPLAPLLREAMDAGRASGALHDGYWNDVGTPERLATAREWGSARGDR